MQPDVSYLVGDSAEPGRCTAGERSADQSRPGVFMLSWDGRKPEGPAVLPTSVAVDTRAR